MKHNLTAFSIPIKGLKQDFYSFDFQLDKSFFDAFENSMIPDGNIKVKMEMERKTSHLKLDFEFEGTIKTECDRCLVEIDLPIEGQHFMIVKFSEETQEDEDEIIYIHPEAHELRVAHYIYEYVNLAVPIRKTYDCEAEETPPCDTSMLAYITSSSDYFENEEDNADGGESEDDNSQPTHEAKTIAWEALKNLKI
jgi:uncharacterized protein